MSRGCTTVTPVTTLAHNHLRGIATVTRPLQPLLQPLQMPSHPRQPCPFGARPLNHSPTTSTRLRPKAPGWFAPRTYPGFYLSSPTQNPVCTNGTSRVVRG